MRSVELFAGAGGLGMGVSLAGYEHLAVIEWDQWACETIRQNQERGFPLVKDWPLHQADVRRLRLQHIPEGIELVSGGPPCQPFSIGGKHRGYEDSRGHVPRRCGVVRKLRPLSFMFEKRPWTGSPILRELLPVHSVAALVSRNRQAVQ